MSDERPLSAGLFTEADAVNAALHEEGRRPPDYTPAPGWLAADVERAEARIAELKGRTKMAKPNDMLRVDVCGYPVSVRGDAARLHLEQITGKMARMKLALHRIADMDPGIAGDIARVALSDGE